MATESLNSLEAVITVLLVSVVNAHHRRQLISHAQFFCVFSSRSRVSRKCVDGGIHQKRMCIYVPGKQRRGGSFVSSEMHACALMEMRHCFSKKLVGQLRSLLRLKYAPQHRVGARGPQKASLAPSCPDPYPLLVEFCSCLFPTNGAVTYKTVSYILLCLRFPISNGF